ncbi:MAG: META domain-containing protein [Chloroflexi bacterium]|nr:META domain-containing protein [Chloroflexota bacterium]MCI0575162.1 META domain-containing protein [Chloroflexota bacterium]MCI0647156.1 META domain-containing protein [Chloroflexota bacterium]MCI0729968.1 META domain-containing protein [Chloroflexota bacterium]
MNQTYWKRTILLLIFLLALAACAPAVEPPASLDGTKWILARYGPAGNPAAVLEGTTVTAAFDNGNELHGSAGCNNYFTTYRVRGSSFHTEPIQQTEMACLAGGVMEQEAAYLAALASATSIATAGDTLTISYDGGELRFTAEPPPPVTPLTGTLWYLVTFETGEVAQSLLNGTVITAAFNDDGTVGGFAGCNGYGGPYQVDGSSLTVVEIASSARGCAEEILAQEEVYINALTAAHSFTLDADRLAIHHEGGALHFAAMPPLDGPPFTGTPWRLVSFGAGAAEPPLAGTEITAVFDGTQISGSAGCNTYSGSYTLSGATMTVGELATTRMACEQAIMDQENAFLAALSQSSFLAVAVNGDQLILVHDDGTLVFAAGEAAGDRE